MTRSGPGRFGPSLRQRFLGPDHGRMGSRVGHGQGKGLLALVPGQGEDQIVPDHSLREEPEDLRGHITVHRMWRWGSGIVRRGLPGAVAP